jgi:hypothetical protein
MSLPPRNSGIIGEQHMRRVHHRVNGVQSRVEKVERAVSPRALKAAIPASTIDGAEFTYQVTEGVCWRFRYNASSASDYKWEFVGGTPWYKAVETQQTTSSLTYVALATALEHTTPFAGDYLVEQGAQAYSAASGGFAYVSHSVGGAATTALDANGMFTQQATVAGNDGAYIFRRTRHDGVAASALIAEAARSGSGTINVLRRSLSLIPVRIG